MMTGAKVGAGGGGPALERYELKYTIPRSMVDDISAFARTYCHLDRYSELSADGFYQVNSLYFDSPEFFFLRQRLSGAEKRFNMRVRTYGSQPTLPYFFEIKHKIHDIVRKYRATIKHESLAEVLEPTFDEKPFLKDARESKNAILFKRLLVEHNATPVVMTSYRRKALFSHCDDYARLTFDIGLRAMPQNEYDPLNVPDTLAPTDLEERFDEGTSVVLELKCYSTQVPLWMVDLIRTFDLKRRGFSKYSAGMAQVFRTYNFDGAARLSPFAAF
jgi:SPX domain protein involved in polyphosphate accumulation